MNSATAAVPEPTKVFLVATEESGDLLGAALMRALRERLGAAVQFEGVGGRHMGQLGLRSLFPIEELMLVGVTGIIADLPRILLRVRETAAAVVRSRTDVFVAIDSPGFTLRVARAVRRGDPSIPILDYVAPSVWAYRSGRARKMARSVDRVLAILPFEPEVFRRLGGPPCTYVGHPLIEQLDKLRPATGVRPPLTSGARPNLLILPGSRRAEIDRLLDIFGDTVALLARRGTPCNALLPAVPHLADDIRRRVRAWAIKPEVVEGLESKFAAFHKGHAALTSTGTATLELALAGVPMIAAYRLDPIVRIAKASIGWGRLMPVRSFVLPNLILGEAAVPEFIDDDCTPGRLADALEGLLRPSAERERQRTAFARLDGLMQVGGGTPSGHAAELVIEAANRRRQPSAAL